MRLELYGDINRYINDVMDIVAAYEIQNNLIISNCLRGKEGADTSSWFMAAIKDDTGVPKLIALMTPPHNLLLYEVNNTPDEAALGLLANELSHLQVPVYGVLAEASLAARFADRYSLIEKRLNRLLKNMRIYRLDKVNDVPVSEGKLRPACENDLFYLPYWNVAFYSDCGIEAVDVAGSIEKVKRSISNKILHVWEDGIPVSQAAMGRKTLNGAVVSAVYTPPHYRGKGYATSCVAGLSSHLLESGYKFCSLFTDLANPVSNSIYMKIGYSPVCDFDEYRFG